MNVRKLVTRFAIIAAFYAGVFFLGVVIFSPSTRAGVADFAPYAQTKGAGGVGKGSNSNGYANPF